MKKGSLLPVLLVYFVDNFSLAIVFPLFSTLILTDTFAFFSTHLDLFTRAWILRAVSMAFPLALLFGAPIMGSLSDRWGRKRTFFLTITATLIGNLLTALAIYLQNYPFLIVCRLLCGFFSGNLTICLATISDLSPSAKKRARNFGYLGATGGLSWVIAMLLGGTLTDPHIPFLFAAALGTLNLFILKCFHETHPEEIRIKKISFSKEIFAAFLTPSVRSLFLIQSLFLLGWLLIFQGFPSYSITAYHAKINETSLALIFIGLSWILGAALINERMVHFLSLKKIPLIGLLCLTILLSWGSFTHHFIDLIIIDCIIAILASFISANLFNLISLTASPSAQGKILGLGQAVNTLAQLATIALGVVLPIRGYTLLYRTAALSTLIAFLLFIFFQYRRKLRSSDKI